MTDESQLGAIMGELGELKYMLKDVGKDTDMLLEEEKEEEKMTDGFDMGAITALMANKGIDPGIIALMKDKESSGFGGGDGFGFLILILLFVLLGGNGNGIFGGGNNSGATAIESVINGQTQYTSVIDALNGNRTAIGDLAVQTGASFGQVQSALCQIQNAITQSNGDIKNAVQACCCNLGNKIDMASCDIEKQILTQTNHIDNGFAGIVQLQTAQFNSVQQSFAAQNAYLAEQFCQIKSREDAREIQTLRDRVAEKELAISQANQTAAIIAALKED